MNDSVKRSSLLRQKIKFYIKGSKVTAIENKVNHLKNIITNWQKNLFSFFFCYDDIISGLYCKCVTFIKVHFSYRNTLQS